MDRGGKEGIKKEREEEWREKGRGRVVSKDMTRRVRGRNEANIRGMERRRKIKKERKRNGEKGW